MILVASVRKRKRPPAALVTPTEGLTKRRTSSSWRLFVQKVPHSARNFEDGGVKRQQRPISFFTERTLAAHLSVSDRTIRNWIRRGELTSYKLGASRRIDPADVEDFLARHRDEAA